MRAWKLRMLVYFRLRDYALEAFQFHMMVNSTATPRVADQLKWSHNEHLNQMLKDSVVIQEHICQKVQSSSKAKH